MEEKIDWSEVIPGSPFYAKDEEDGDWILVKFHHVYENIPYFYENERVKDILYTYKHIKKEK